MEQKDKPQLAEVLGVKVGQKWRVVCPEEGIDSAEVCLNDKGHLIDVYGVVSSVILCAAINHPESIIRSLPLTEQELELCRVFKVKYLTRNVNSWCVHMWNTRPSENEGGMGKYYAIDIREESEIGAVDAKFFPSIEPGDCICVEEERYADYIEEDEAEERRP